MPSSNHLVPRWLLSPTLPLKQSLSMLPCERSFAITWLFGTYRSSGCNRMPDRYRAIAVIGVWPSEQLTQSLNPSACYVRLGGNAKLRDTTVLDWEGPAPLRSLVLFDKVLKSARSSSKHGVHLGFCDI